MKMIRFYSIVFLLLTACTGPTENQSEPVALPEVLPATDTPAPYPDDTPLPVTLPAPVVAAPSVTSLHMLNELDGWGITTNAIIRTTDGGMTWYNLSPAGETSFGYGIANTFLSTSLAWVLVAETNDPQGSGTLYRTSDGGLTWKAFPVPFGGGEMVFIDEQQGWMMAFRGIAAGSMGVAIYQTDDGGESWARTYTNDPNLGDAGDSLPLGGIKNSFTPLDSQTAWVGGVIYAPETFYLYKTVDGGATWSEQPLPAAPDMQNADIAIDTGPIFPSPGVGILPVRFMEETRRTVFYITQDGGQTWEFASFIPGLGAVDFVSPTEGFFWTGEQFFFTEDGAKTWSTTNADVLFGESFAGMDFVNRRTGWVWTYDQTGQYGLYKTVDGGNSWLPAGE